MLPALLAGGFSAVSIRKRVGAGVVLLHGIASILARARPGLPVQRPADNRLPGAAGAAMMLAR
jgi:hypothetical protein